MSNTPPPEKRALVRAAAILQGQAALAAALGYTDRRCVWPYFSTARQFPPEQCPAVERATALRGQVVTCEELRPDVPWRRIPDEQWQWHPQGRPVWDVAAAALLRAAA